MRNIRIKKSALVEMVRHAINEVYYSSGDLGMDYDQFDDYGNDLSIYDDLYDDEISKIKSEDAYEDAMRDDRYMADIARECQDYEENAPMDIDEEAERKLLRRIPEEVVRRLRFLPKEKS